MTQSRPRVLVTGGSGVVGIGAARWLDRLGITPVLLARHQPDHVPFGAEFVRGDITAIEDVHRATDGCAAVIHLAWTMTTIASPAASYALDIGGTGNVLEAMKEAGIPRIVFASSITAYGAHPDHPQPYTEDEPLRPSNKFRYEANKAKAERMITASGLEAVLARSAVVVGRAARNRVTDVFAQPVLAMPRGDIAMQFVHQDDVGRFFATVALEGPTGPVNLAPEDTVTIPEVATLLDRRLLRPPMPVSKRVAAVVRKTKFMEAAPELVDLFAHFPVGDTTRLRQDFGFRCAYSSHEALADFGRSITNLRVIGTRRFTKLSALTDREVLPFDSTDDDGRSLAILPRDVAGEFDNPDVDPAYPEWTAANVGEAYPSPMTALGLELALDMMRAAGPVALDFLGSVDEATDRHIKRKMVASHAHGIRVNLTLLRQVNDAVPGQTHAEFDYNILGIPLPDGFARTAPRLADLPTLIGIAGRTTPKLLGLPREVDRLVARAATVMDRIEGIAELPDEVLLAKLDQLWDELVKGWIITGATTFLVSIPQSAVERVLGPGAMSELDTEASGLMSLGPLKGVRAMLAEVQAVPGLIEDLRNAPAKDRVDLLRTRAPRAHAALEDLVARIGHRGPGEMELANDTFADRPELLLETLLHQQADRPAAGRRTTELSALQRRLVARAYAAMARRELARDAMSRTIHALRKVAREHGARLAARGLIAAPGDVFHLTRQQLAKPPADARTVIARRKAERERLAELALPVTFNGPWTPPADAAGSVSELSGLGASSGTVRGRVRIMRSPTDPLASGEILVTRVTDVGWTPLFGCAAAVVTDLGAAMSHAAIVAREFGIPAVVGVGDASLLLTTGQLVEVDGAAGTIRVLEPTATSR